MSRLLRQHTHQTESSRETLRIEKVAGQVEMKRGRRERALVASSARIARLCFAKRWRPACGMSLNIRRSRAARKRACEAQQRQPEDCHFAVAARPAVRHGQQKSVIHIVQDETGLRREFRVFSSRPSVTRGGSASVQAGRGRCGSGGISGATEEADEGR